MGSLLAIRELKAGLGERFTAPPRGPGHQLLSYDVGTGSQTVVHDGAGRVVEDGPRTYLWDDFSALAAVKEAGALVEALQYDGLGRLVARWDGGGLVEAYSWDGAQMVTGQDGAGQPTWAAWWGAGVDALVAVTTPGGDYLAQHDARGSVAGYFDAAGGHLAATLEYTPEGRVAWKQLDAQGQVVTDCKETGAARCPGALGIPFGHHSAFTSAATGLVYFRNRWYSATANQWLSQDPLGAVDSANLYAFNGFDAVNFVDPWGLGSQPLAGDQKPYPLPPASDEIVPGQWGVDISDPPGPECDADCKRLANWERFHPTGPGGGGPVKVCNEYNDYCTRAEPAAPARPANPPPRNPLDPSDPRPDLCRSSACKVSALRLLVRRHDPNADLRIPTPKGQAFLARNERFIGHSYFLQNNDNLFGPPRDFIDWIRGYGGFDIGVGLTHEDEDLQPVSDEVADERFRRGALTLADRAVEYGGILTFGLEAASRQGVTRVGRWMSPAEHDAMVASGKVQESWLKGVTSVSNPPDPSKWVRQTSGTRYVEFDVPTSAVRGAGDNSKIYGPSSLFGPKTGVTTMPPATNIQQAASKVPR